MAIDSHTRLYNRFHGNSNVCFICYRFRKIYNLQTVKDTHMHTQTHLHTAKEKDVDYRKICETDLPKNRCVFHYKEAYSVPPARCRLTAPCRLVGRFVGRSVDRSGCSTCTWWPGNKPKMPSFLGNSHWSISCRFVKRTKLVQSFFTARATRVPIHIL